MNKFISLLVVYLIISELKHSNCFKWISLKYDDILPIDAIIITKDIGPTIKSIGRTDYLNTVQLADIFCRTRNYNSNVKIINHTQIDLNSNKIERSQFEVLVPDGTNDCEWVMFDKKRIPENVVRGGTAWDLEPVFVGKRYNDVTSIYLTSTDKNVYMNSKCEEIHLEILICNNNHKWVDATSSSVPENSVRTGGADGYVARLLGPKLHVPGIVYPKSNQTSIWYKNKKLESFNIEVLIGQPQQYKWKNMKPRTGIPENAVVCGVSDNNELTYIAKKYYDAFEGTNVFPITFSDTNYIDDLFKILVDTTFK